jgi:hypothetical protein
MAVKKKRAAKAAPTPPIEMIVRRGALRRFDKLKQATAELPVKLLWDRRTREGPGTAKPGEPESQHAERRKKPPFTWDVADFLVVGKPAGARRRRTKR